MDRLLESRWDEVSSFEAAWDKRSVEMLQTFDDTVPEATRVNFSEYGCGPYAPFTAAVAKSDNSRTVKRFDRKKWDADCGLVDFNTEATTELISTDVGVLSGVLEYLNDVPTTLSLLGQHHRYALFSYAYWSETSGSEGIAVLDRRCHRGGWRNHYTLRQIVEIANHAGVILRASESIGQVILLISYELRKPL